MRTAHVLLIVFAFVILLSVAPQPLQPALDSRSASPVLQNQTAADGAVSADSVTSFSQTNPADDSFWPDGMNYSVANSKDYHNFVGIGDFVSYNLGTGESKGTSGDYGYIRCKAIGADDWSGMYTNRPSFTAASLGNTYFEIRYKGNCTGQAVWRVNGYTLDAMGGTGWVIASLTQTTTWSTYRALLPTTNALESLSLVVEITTGQPAVEIDYDYMLLTPSQLGGWQHDCSGTGNITTISGSAPTSDGDKVTFSGSGSWNIDADGSTIQALIPKAYYPFVELSVTAITGTIMQYVRFGLSSVNGLDYIGAAGIYRYYLGVYGTAEYLGFRVSLSAGQSITYDWVAFYAIANFTTTVTSGALGDVASVSSNTLCVTKASASLFQFDRDQAISVAAATYQRWNISTATETAVGCSLYVSPSWTTKDRQSTWKTPTGTVTDMIIRATASCAISAFKFVTDGSIPLCLWSYVVPTNPTPSQSVTLSAVVTDTYPPTVYHVYFRPLVYPAGFSAVDYSATKQANNVWNYTFSSLPLTGYYVFAIIGTDGANNSTLGATTYLTFSVTEFILSLSNTWIFPSNDWIYMSFVTNQRTATYYVWDNATYVGGSNEGFYRVVIPTSLGLHNFTILINGSQTSIDATHQVRNFAASSKWLWQNFKYTVNPVQLSFDSVTFIQNNESVIISGRVFTSATTLYWTVYEASLGWTSGTISGISSGSWLSWMWDKSSTTSTSNFTVEVTDGTYNTTFRGFYLKISGNSWISFASSYTEDKRTYIQNTYQQMAEGIVIGPMTVLAIGIVSIIMTVAVAIIWKYRVQLAAHHNLTGA